MLDQWLNWAQIERGLRPNTVQAYERELRRLQEAEGPLEQMVAAQLRSYLYDRGGKAATFAKRLAALRSFYGWLVRTEQRPDDPTRSIDRPKVQRGLPRPVDDLEDRLGALEGPFRLAAVFLTETGLRISEACELEVAVPAPTDLIVLGKGGREELVPLTKEARQALDALGGRMPASKRTIQRKFREAGFTPHQLRHHLGTALAESGADLGDIQDILRHRSPETSRIYTRYSTERLRRAHDRRRHG